MQTLICKCGSFFIYIYAYPLLVLRHYRIMPVAHPLFNMLLQPRSAVHVFGWQTNPPTTESCSNQASLQKRGGARTVSRFHPVLYIQSLVADAHAGPFKQITTLYPVSSILSSCLGPSLLPPGTSRRPPLPDTEPTHKALSLMLVQHFITCCGSGGWQILTRDRSKARALTHAASIVRGSDNFGSV